MLNFTIPTGEEKMAWKEKVSRKREARRICIGTGTEPQGLISSVVSFSKAGILPYGNENSRRQKLALVLTQPDLHR